MPLPKELVNACDGAIITAWFVTEPDDVAVGAAVADTPPIVSALTGEASDTSRSATD
tara:strand:+ start:192 stop:362 length:171 start_codon:yes stop_codon:yes gene_type:complete